MILLVTVRIGATDVDVRRLHTLVIDREQSELCLDLVVAPQSKL